MPSRNSTRRARWATVRQLCGIIRRETPPAISENMIRRHIVKAGCRADEAHRYQVKAVLAAVMRHRAEDNRGIEADVASPRSRLIELRCAEKQMEIDRARGAYLKASDVEKAWMMAGTTIKEKLMSIGQTLAPMLVGKKAPQIRGMIDEKIREALIELTGVLKTQ